MNQSGQTGFTGRLTASTIGDRSWKGKYMTELKEYMCIVCGFVYREADGLPEDGIAPGTRWEDIPADWECPECGAGKEDFDMIEI